MTSRDFPRIEQAIQFIEQRAVDQPKLEEVAPKPQNPVWMTIYDLKLIGT